MKRRNGFALLAVIWGLGIISLLLISFLSVSRLRLQWAYNLAGSAQASFIAEAGINLALVSLLSEANGTSAASLIVHAGEPIFCSLEGATVGISIEDESGKIDLNNATAEMLETAFVGFGVSATEARALAEAIVEFRGSPTDNRLPAHSDYQKIGEPFGPKHAPFSTIFELDQVIGVEAPLLRDLLPFLTVHSFGPGINAQAAPPALFAALAGFPMNEVQDLRQSPFPNKLNRNARPLRESFLSNRQGGGNTLYSVHAEALLPTGQIAVREAIVEIGAFQNKPFAIREMRHGASRHLGLMQAAMKSGGLRLPGC